MAWFLRGSERRAKACTRAVVITLLMMAGLHGAGETLPSVNSGTITGGAAPIAQSLNVSGVPAGSYLFFRVTADFVANSATPAQSAWSDSIQIALVSGSTVLHDFFYATEGRVQVVQDVALTWTAIMAAPYAGGDPLTIQIQDTYTDASGPYTSDLNNITVTLYVAPAPANPFTTYSAGQLTGGGAASTHTFSTGSVPAGDYLFYTVQADWDPYTVTPAQTAWSNSIQFQLDDGASNVYRAFSLADFGEAANPNPTTLSWSGIVTTPYTAGGTLRGQFRDNYNDASGPYYSTVSNVRATIYPATDSHAFSTYGTGTLTGGGAAHTRSFSVGGVPAGEYLFYVIEGTFVPNPNTAQSAWSNSIELQIEGAGDVLKAYAYASEGALAQAVTTTLYWSGMLNRTYVAGQSLSVLIRDDYTDASGPYTSEVQDVTVTIYEAPAGNSPPEFDDADNAVAFAVSEDASNIDLDTYLAVTDADTSDTLTWTVSSAPNNGGTIGTGGTQLSTGGSVTPTGFSYAPAANFSGTETFSMQVSDGTANDTIAFTVTINDAPEVSAVWRGTSSPTNADILGFTVVFTAGVVGVNSGDFSVVGSTATVSGVFGTHTNYIVEVSGGDLANLNGTVGLEVVDNDSITAGGVPLGGIGTSGAGDGSFSGGESITVDNIAPTAQSVVRKTPAGALTTSGNVTFTITFSEELDTGALVLGDFSLLSTGGGSSPNASSMTVTSASGNPTVLDVTFDTTGMNEGTLSVQF